MRVLAVTNMYPTKETPTSGTFIKTQIEGLRRSGVEVEVLFLNRLQDGMRVYSGMKQRLEPFLRGGAGLEIVHAMYGGVMAERVTRAVRDRPVVVTFHGSDLHGQPLSPLSRRTIAWLGVQASRIAARRASEIVSVADHLSRLLPPSVDRCRVHIVPCGIDLDRFRPMDRKECRRRLGWDDEDFCVLFSNGNSDPIKRPELAHAAVHTLRSKNVPVKLRILHSVPYGDVPYWINASDVLLLTSLKEGSPTIVKESLACNRPVVSTPVGDVPELLADLAGCHVAPPDATKLAAKLQLVYDEKPDVRSRERVARQSDLTSAARILQVYEQARLRFSRECASQSILCRADRVSPRRA